MASVEHPYVPNAHGSAARKLNASKMTLKITRERMSGGLARIDKVGGNR